MTRCYHIPDTSCLVLAFMSHIVLVYHVPCAAFLESNSNYGYLDGLLRILCASAVVAAGLFALYCFPGYRCLKEINNRGGEMVNK